MPLASGEAYCIKCRGGKPMKNARFARYKNNAPVMKGQCVDCGTNVTKMLSREDALREELKNMEGNPD